MSSSPGPEPAQPIESVFPASLAALHDIRAFVTRQAHAAAITDPELDRIVMVTSEIATNAIKHSGTNVVCVGWQDTGQGVCVTVADEGAFEVSGRDIEDRGCGLKIVLGLADEVTIRAGRRGERGTTILLHVPVHSRLDTEPAGVSRRPRLLIVDADRFAGRSLSSFLDAEGYGTTVAGSVQAGHAALASPPQVAIVDLMTSNGLAVELCEDLTHAGVPVLAMSILPPPVPLRSSRFLRKPVHPLEVLAVVRHLTAPAAAGLALGAPHG